MSDLISAPLDGRGEPVLWPVARSTRRTPVTREAVETVLVYAMMVLGISSLSALGMAIGYSATAALKWYGADRRCPSTAAVMRILYLLCWRARLGAQWDSDVLRSLNWSGIHQFAIPYTPYRGSGSRQARGDLAGRRGQALFRPSSQYRKKASAFQLETVATLTITHLHLGSLGGLTKALNAPAGTCESWEMFTGRPPTPEMLLRLAYIWLLHLNGPRQWTGGALTRIDWLSIHEHGYGIPYEPYEKYGIPRDSQEVLEFLERRAATRSQPPILQFTPIVRTGH